MQKRGPKMGLLICHTFQSMFSLLIHFVGFRFSNIVKSNELKETKCEKKQRNTHSAQKGSTKYIAHCSARTSTKQLFSIVDRSKRSARINMKCEIMEEEEGNYHLHPFTFANRFFTSSDFFLPFLVLVWTWMGKCSCQIPYFEWIIVCAWMLFCVGCGSFCGVPIQYFIWPQNIECFFL